MAEALEINISSNGITTLKTAGKYCEQNIQVNVQVEGGSGSPGGSVDGGYTVTFLSEGVQYAVSSVTAGQVISQPTVPRPEGKYFSGWYTDATAGTKIEFPYTPTGDITLYAHFSEQTIVGFTGLTNSSGVLTLTDDLAGLENYTKSTSGACVSVTSPLDSVWPFNAIEEYLDGEGNAFVKFPKFYMRWVTNSSGYIDGVRMSNLCVDSADGWFLPDCFRHPANLEAETDYFALAKYEASGSASKMYSKSGVACLVNVTRAQARTAARAYGNADNYYNGYQQLDFAQYIAYNLLCMMYYRTSNIQTVFGGRTSKVQKWSEASVTGTCDAISVLNGWNSTTDCVKMLGIENPYGNIFKWVDGVFFSKTSIYAHRLPVNFADSTTGATSLGFSRPTESKFIKFFKKGTTVAAQSYMYCASVGGSETTYCADYCYYAETGVVLYVGGSWDVTSDAGLWYLRGNYAASLSGSYIGARLSFRPL